MSSLSPYHHFRGPPMGDRVKQWMSGTFVAYEWIFLNCFTNIFYKFFCENFNCYMQDTDFRSTCSPELEIVVELGNLVPRKTLVSQKVFLILRYLQSWTAKMFLKLLQILLVLLRLYQFLWHTHDFLFWNQKFV